MIRCIVLYDVTLYPNTLLKFVLGIFPDLFSLCNVTWYTMALCHMIGGNGIKIKKDIVFYFTILSMHTRQFFIFCLCIMFLNISIVSVCKGQKIHVKFFGAFISYFYSFQFVKDIEFISFFVVFISYKDRKLIKLKLSFNTTVNQKLVHFLWMIQLNTT